MLLPNIVNALSDCGTRFEEQRLYISTALFEDRRPYCYRTLSTLSLCEGPSALLLYTVIILTHLLLSAYFEYYLFLVKKGPRIRLLKKNFLCVFQIYSFNATVNMSPVPFWRAIRRLSSMKVLSFTNVTDPGG